MYPQTNHAPTASTLFFRQGFKVNRMVLEDDLLEKGPCPLASLVKGAQSGLATLVVRNIVCHVHSANCKHGALSEPCAACQKNGLNRFRSIVWLEPTLDHMCVNQQGTIKTPAGKGWLTALCCVRMGREPALDG